MKQTRTETAAYRASRELSREYRACFEDEGYGLDARVSRLGLRDAGAPERSRQTPCIVATLYPMLERRQAMGIRRLMGVAKCVIPESEGRFRVFLEYSE